MEKIEVIKTRLDKINLIFAYTLVFMPLVTLLLGFWSGFSLAMELVYFSVAYLIFLIFHLPYLGLLGGWKERIKSWINFPTIVACVMLVWALVTGFAHGKVNVTFLHYLGFFEIYICFRKLDKSKYKNLIYTFLVVLLVSVVCGLIDPHGTFIPGFHTEGFPYSIEFTNPNYSGYVVTVALVYVISKLSGQTTRNEKILFISCFVLFSVFLFANGSFVPISGVVLFSIIMIIFKWVKLKKCPLELLSIFLSFLILSILIDFCPWWTKYRNCGDSYLWECVAVFDNIFHTHIYEYFRGDVLAGADGWDRNSLALAALRTSCSSVTAFLFGFGPGYYLEIRPHMHLLALWLDFGIVVPVCYVLLVGYVIYKFFKNKQNQLANLTMISCFGVYSIMAFFGSMTFQSFTYFVPVFAMAYKYICNSETTESESEQPKEQIKPKTTKRKKQEAKEQ